MSMESLVKSFDIEIATTEKKLSRLRDLRDRLVEGSHTAIEIVSSAHTSLPRTGVKVDPGQWQGLKPHQAIASYLKDCGNPGVTLAEITRALLTDGTVLSKDLQYPLRAVSLSVRNAKDTFRIIEAKHAEDKIVYLK